MASTQTPTENPTPSIPPPKQEPSDLYDARYWESAYRNIDEPPALLLKLQDDLTQSRRREAFWISVVVHLVVVLLVFNSDKLVRLLPRQTAMVMNPEVMPRDKDLTYLELPPDAQKVPKPRDTNIISDKDRVATSKAPDLDRKELKKILDSSRPGRPGPMAPPSPSQQPSPQAAASAPAPTPQSQQGEQSAQVPPPPSPQNQIAKLQTPRVGSQNPFNTGPQYAGSQIAQATRAVGSNPGGYSGGGGDFGLGTGKQGRAFGNLDVLSDTMGVDFSSYLAQVLYRVKASWYNQIPESAKAPIMKKGKLSIEFAILKNGSVGGMKLAASSGDVALDRGAWGGITGANPFPPLPKEFAGQFLSLRFNFYYNPDEADLR